MISERPHARSATRRSCRRTNLEKRKSFESISRSERKKHTIVDGGPRQHVRCSKVSQIDARVRHHHTLLRDLVLCSAASSPHYLLRAFTPRIQSAQDPAQIQLPRYESRGPKLGFWRRGRRLRGAGAAGPGIFIFRWKPTALWPVRALAEYHAPLEHTPRGVRRRGAAGGLWRRRAVVGSFYRRCRPEDIDCPG